MKLKVVSSYIYGNKERFWQNQENKDYRIYNIVSFMFLRNGEKDVWNVSKVFTYTGIGKNTTCQAKDLATLEVKLHDTNWISPSAAARVDGKDATVYDHYEIHSVYFMVPKNYWNKYEYLYSIDAFYDVVHLTPIIVTQEPRYR